MSDTDLIRRLGGGDNPDGDHRRGAFVQTANGFALLLAVYAVVIAILLPGAQLALWIAPFASICCALAAQWAKRAKSLTAPASVILAIGVACVVGGACINGGVDDYTMPFLIIAPIVAGYFLGARGALACGAAATLGVAALAGADIAGLVPESPYSQTAFEAATAVVLVVAIAMTLLTAVLFSKRAEAHASRVRENNELLFAFARTAPIAVAMFDRNVRYIEVSDRWLSDYGLTREDVIGRSHYDVFPETPDAWKAVHARCLKGATERAESDRFERADGSLQWLLWEVRPWRKSRGDIGGVIMISRDITDQVEARENLKRATRRAEDALAAKSSFLATMSHEIRTPLNAVIGLTEALLDTSLDDRQRTLLTEANRSGAHLLTLVSDILDLAKLEAGKMQIDAAPFSLRGLLTGVAQMFATASRQKGVELDVVFAPGAPNEIVGDENRLRQILVNLVGNALKFTAEGRIDIAVSAALNPASNPAIDRASTMLTIEVRDTGPGIAPDRIAHLFDAFTQEGPATARHYGGTGLGLAICRKLAEEMNGEIACESAPGEGSVFRVALPVRTGMAVETAPRPTYDGALKGLSVLFADDNAGNRLVYEETARVLGCAFNAVSNGREARDACAMTRYDAVVLDIEMPEMGGVEAAEAIRRQAPERAPPCIAVTAHALAGDRERFLGLGMAGYVAKPISRRSLAEAVLAAVHKSNAAAPPAETAASSLLDDAIIADLRRTLGPDRAPGLFAELWESLAKIIAALQDAGETGDPALTRKLAHDACGLAANLGAAALSRTLKSIELGARDGSVSNDDLAGLGAIENDSRRTIEQRLAEG